MSVTQARRNGAIVMGMAAVGAVVFIARPVMDVMAGVAASVDFRAFGITTMMMAFGAVMLFGSARQQELLNTPWRTREHHRLVWPLFGGSFALGMGLWWLTSRSIGAVMFGG
jgi:hypothetical protein